MALDCQSCGACCVGLDVLLSAEEAARFAAEPALVRVHSRAAGPALYFMARDAATDRCLALQGPLSACRCTIYEHRPALCRELAAGSVHCHEARRRVHGVGQ